MPTDKDIAYRRSRRPKEASGSLVFDQQRKRARGASENDEEVAGVSAAVKKAAVEKFPG